MQAPCLRLVLVGLGFVVTSAGCTCCRPAPSCAPPVTSAYEGAPPPGAPFVGSSYEFVPPAAGTGEVTVSSSYAAPVFRQPRYTQPGPYYYTPAYEYTPGYYSYYYTPGYFRY